MNRRRIATVIESLGRGGAERLLVTQHRHLDPARFETLVVSLFEPTPLAPALEACGATVVRLSLPGPVYLPVAVGRLRAILRQWRADVVHTHLYYANVAGRLAAAGRTPVFTSLHNPDYSYEDPGTHVFQLKKWLDRETGRRWTDRLIAVSHHVQRDYERQLGFADIQVLHNFVDVTAIRRRLGEIDRSSVRDRLGLTASEQLILQVGRLHPQKGHDRTLRALASLEEVPWRAAFVGAGPQESLRALARSLGVHDRVRWVGGVEDVVPYYAAADLFVFPSRYEAFGIALLEAMTAGLPSVVSDAPGILEVVGGDAAAVAAHGEPEALALHLQALLADPERRARLAAAASSRADHFDVHRQLPRLEEWYADA